MHAVQNWYREQMTMKKRQQTGSRYNKETKPLIDYYEKAGNIAHIDGTIGLENVFNKIVEIVGE